IGVVYGRDGEVAEETFAQAFGSLALFVLLPSAITFYGFYFLIFPHFLLKKKFWQAAGLGLFIAVFAVNIGASLIEFQYNESCFADPSTEDENILGAFIFGTFVALLSGIIALVIQGFLVWFEEIKLKENLRQRNEEMELALVKAKLDPHFLFNTINNIDVLVTRQADRASDYLNKLSEIMRFTLYETHTDRIPLNQELRYIEKYIDLQKIRTSNPDYVNYSIEGDASQRKIAPMVFIPFIENAFKHTHNKKLKNAIDIRIQIEDEWVSMHCENKTDYSRVDESGFSGLGNELIRKRLELLYPEQHHLEIKQYDNRYRVNLSIQHG
ncbi:MAG: histidine kinase, partial [Bacteroidota bacterium]